MILLIDAGNTRIKWRCFQQGELFGGGHQVHHGNLTPELLQKIWGSLPAPSSVWGVNVAGARIAEQISQWSNANWGQVPNFVTASQQTGNVVNGYHEPEKLGADRWMALVGADRITQEACCIADCGSAVTIDCMNGAHEHIGGLIIPGLTMMPWCVSSNTAQVAFTEGEAGWLGMDTPSCLASGATQSIVGALTRTAELMKKKFSPPVTLIIAGGDAPKLLPWLGNEWIYEPDLIFIGLAAAMQHHKG
jgi:type III pantothenate kinase